MEQASNQSSQETFVWHKDGYLAYGIVMFCILTIGFVGNILALLVLYQRQHRNRSITPLMVNLALADIFIIVFGYPMAIQTNLRGKLLDSKTCVWSAFVNGAVGIASIITLTEMVLVSYLGLKEVRPNKRLTGRQIASLISMAWIYGGLCMLPPLLGWNRFVLNASKVSCCPDWSGKSVADTTYNILLVTMGFFIPLSVMAACYYRIYRIVHQAVVPGNIAVQLRQRNSELKIVRMTALAVSAFVLSWSPYCFVSLTAVFTHKPVLASGEAEVPELLAKASVIYNPIVYTIMNSRFRATLLHVLRLRRRASLDNRFMVLPVRERSQHDLQNGPLVSHNHGNMETDENNKEVYKGQRHLQVTSAFETRVQRTFIVEQM